MIEVTSIRVKSFDLDHLDVFWELNHFDNERLEEYDFFVLRSTDGFGGPYDVIAGPFYNTFLFRDSGVRLIHKWRKYYYKIKTVHRSSGREREFGPEWHRAEPDLIALEIIRRETVLFKEHAGRQVILYPALTFGQRCKNCWDLGPRGNTIGRPVQQNCVTCFDTTFVQGFATPMLIHMQIDTSPIAPRRTDLKEHQPIVTTARSTIFPPLQPKDMIVEAENKRWVIEQVGFTEKARFKIRQEPRMTNLEKDDIKYAVPVNLELAKIHTPERNLTRPHSLQIRHNRPLTDDTKPPA